MRREDVDRSVQTSENLLVVERRKSDRVRREDAGEWAVWGAAGVRGAASIYTHVHSLP